MAMSAKALGLYAFWVLSASAVIYLSWVFITWSWSPVDWGRGARQAAALLWTGSAITGTLITIDALRATGK